MGVFINLVGANIHFSSLNEERQTFHKTIHLEQTVAAKVISISVMKLSFVFRQSEGEYCIIHEALTMFDTDVTFYSA